MSKMWSLEQFIFNMATLFLDEKELYFFKIFVLANKTTDREQSLFVNNVYNHYSLFNYIEQGSVPMDELAQLETEWKTGESKEINESINSLFDKGFIVRYAKYISSKIEWKTPLTFKATNFVDHFRDELIQLYNQLKEQLKGQTQQRGRTYICKSTKCENRQLTDEQEALINLQLGKKFLRDVNCPQCHEINCLLKIEKAKQNATLQKAFEYIEELREEAIQLNKQSLEDADFLERELRAMRSVFNDKITIQFQQKQQQEKDLDRRLIFQNKEMALQEKESLKKTRLELARRGVNTNSIYYRKGPVYKAPRYYQSGLVGSQKPEWLEDVYKRAQDVLKKE